jgi:hypothetical protein
VLVNFCQCISFCQVSEQTESQIKSIKDITSEPTITYDEYFRLAKLAATPKPVDPSSFRSRNSSLTDDPFQLGSLDGIQQLKLDRDGKDGLMPKDFLIVAKIALKSANPFVLDTLLEHINTSNYRPDEKKWLFAQLEREDSDEEAQTNNFQYTAIDLDDLTPESTSSDYWTEI